jgi:hypothetical protein
MMKNINSIPILFLVTDDHCMTEGKNMPNWISFSKVWTQARFILLHTSHFFKLYSTDLLFWWVSSLFIYLFS